MHRIDYDGLEIADRNQNAMEIEKRQRENDECVGERMLNVL